MKKDVTYLLKKINDKFKLKVDAHLKTFDLTVSQAKVLHFIGHCSGFTTQKQIEEFLEVSHPTVVGLLSRLEKSGYIECGYDESHGKNKTVRQTEKAVKFSHTMYDFFVRANNDLVKGLSKEEQEELERLLCILYENVKK